MNPVTIFLVIALSFVAYWYLTIPTGIPPGPMGLPLLGYLPFLGDKPYLKFTELSKKYGPVFSFYLGSRLVVVLNDFSSIREAFVKQADNFSGRPIGFNLSFFRSSKDTKSISMTDGPYWKDHRRFITHYLRDCGMGKNTIEPQIMNEIEKFIAAMKSKEGKPTNFVDLITLSVCNNVAILALGRRFEYDDPWFLAVKTLNDKIVAHNVVNFRIAISWLQYVPFVDVFISRTMRMALEKTRLMMDRVLSRGEELPEDRTSYAAVFRAQRRSQPEGEKDRFSDDSLVQNIRTLMSAGTETTANTLLWSIKYMTLYPEVQEKVRHEVDEIIGRDRMPTFTDRTRTPYLEATICEIQRMSTLVPLNIPHRNRMETNICGYRIPKSTYIISNLFGVHMDARYWNDPEQFRPERFLDGNGNLKKREEFLVFSLGKRQCLGEPLARMELYLYMASMLQHFIFEPSPGRQVNTDSILGLTLRPKESVFRAVPRN